MQTVKILNPTRGGEGSTGLSEPERNMRGPSLDPWTWTGERERAAQLVADGHLTNDEIAVECGVSGRSLRDWKRCLEFRERVRQCLAEFRAKLAVEGLALKSNRIALLMGRAATLRGIVRARGKDPRMANAPGTTALQKGLQMRTIKSIGSGVSAREVEEYVLDTGLLDEERQYLQHIATELGEWKQVIDLKGTLTTDAPPKAMAIAKAFTLEAIEAAMVVLKAAEEEPSSL
jgi:hypothetical protein